MQHPLPETKRKKAPNKNKNVWREIISTFENSNESYKDFCAKMNINPGTLAHWRQVFKKENTSPPKLLEVKIKEPLNSSCQCIIESPSGYKIILGNNTTIESLQNILRLLGLII